MLAPLNDDGVAMVELTLAETGLGASGAGAGGVSAYGLTLAAGKPTVLLPYGLFVAFA